MTHRAVTPREHIERGYIRIFLAHVVPRVLAADVGKDLQMAPAAFLLEIDEPVDRRACNGSQRNTLLD